MNGTNNWKTSTVDSISLSNVSTYRSNRIIRLQCNGSSDIIFKKRLLHIANKSYFELLRVAMKVQLCNIPIQVTSDDRARLHQEEYSRMCNNLKISDPALMDWTQVAIVDPPLLPNISWIHIIIKYLRKPVVPFTPCIVTLNSLGFNFFFEYQTWTISWIFWKVCLTLCDHVPKRCHLKPHCHLDSDTTERTLEIQNSAFWFLSIHALSSGRIYNQCRRYQFYMTGEALFN